MCPDLATSSVGSETPPCVRGTLCVYEVGLAQLTDVRTVLDEHRAFQVFEAFASGNSFMNRFGMYLTLFIWSIRVFDEVNGRMKLFLQGRRRTSPTSRILRPWTRAL